MAETEPSSVLEQAPECAPASLEQQDGSLNSSALATDARAAQAIALTSESVAGSLRRLREERQSWRADKLELEQLRRLVHSHNPVSLSTQLQTLLEERADQEEQLELSGDQVIQLKEQVHTLQTENKELQTQVLGWKNASQDAARIRDLEEQVNKWEVLYFESAEMGERRIQKLEEQLEEALNSTEESKKVATQTQKRVSQLEGELEAKSVHGESVANEADAKVGAMKEQIEILESKLKNQEIEDDDSSHHSDDHDMEQYVGEIERQLHAKELELVEVNDRLNQERDVAKNREELLRKQLQTIRDEHKKAELERQALTMTQSVEEETGNKSEELEQECERYKNKVEDQKKELAATRSELEAARKENVQLRLVKDSLMGIDQEMEELIESLEPLQTELADQTDKAKTAMEEAARLKHELNKETFAKQEVERENRKLEADVKTAKDSLDNVYMELKDEQAAKEELVEKNKQEIETVQASVEYYKKSLEVMQEALQEANEDLRGMKVSPPPTPSHQPKSVLNGDAPGEETTDDNEMVVKLRAERNELQMKLEGLATTNDGADKEKQLVALQRQVSDLEAEKAALDLENTMTAHESASLMDSLRNSEEKIESLETQIRQGSSNPETVSNGVPTNVAKEQHLATQLEESHQKVKDLEQELDEWKTKTSQVQEKSKIQIEHLSTELEELRTTSSQTIGRLELERKETLNSDARVTELEQEIVDLQDQFKFATKEILARSAQLQQELDELQTESSAKGAEAKRKVEALEKELQQAQSQSAETIQSLESQLQQKSASPVEDKPVPLPEASERIADLERELEEVKTEASAAASRAKQEAEALKQEMERGQARTTDVDPSRQTAERVAELEASLENLRTEASVAADGAKQTIENLEKELAQVRLESSESIAEMLSQLNATSASPQVDKKDSEMAERVSELERELEKVRSEGSEKVNQAQQNIKSMETEMEQVRAEASERTKSLELQLEEAKAGATTADQSSDLQKEIMDLKEQLGVQTQWKKKSEDLEAQNTSLKKSEQKYRNDWTELKARSSQQEIAIESLQQQLKDGESLKSVPPKSFTPQSATRKSFTPPSTTPTSFTPQSTTRKSFTPQSTTPTSVTPQKEKEVYISSLSVKDRIRLQQKRTSTSATSPPKEEPTRPRTSVKDRMRSYQAGGS